MGDLDLVGAARGWGAAPLVLAVVDAHGVRTAGVAADPDQDVEIGSISKGLTALLYEDALARGEVQRNTRLDHLLAGLRGSPVGTVRLDALATHHSGLPRLARGSGALRRTYELYRYGRNPYPHSLSELLALARHTELGHHRGPLYSNLGYQLLGHAVAAGAGRSYPDLVAERLAAPLGLTATYVPVHPSHLRETAMAGASPRGRARDPWVGEALAPAGGIRASVGDLARLAAAMLAGSAPGTQALDHRERFGLGTRIGSGWITLAVPVDGGQRRDRKGHRTRVRRWSDDGGAHQESFDQLVTWHNGGTGGFRSFLGMDRERGIAVAIVSPRSRSVDRYGFELLADLARA